MDNQSNTMGESVKEILQSKLTRYYGITADEATNEQMYHALQLTLREILSQKRANFSAKVKESGAKRIYYLSIEFLVGRQMRNNIMNLGLGEEVRALLAESGHDLDKIYECETDPGLGNGGLGRLAACYMDGLTTLSYPATGYSILYEYGLFKQKIIEGDQVELPDVWLPDGSAWLQPRNDRAVTVRLGGKVNETWKNGQHEIIYTDYEEVQAIPYDLMVSGGAGCEAVNRLRLWKAKDMSTFNMGLFSQGEYVKAIQQASNAEVISKVLYPADNHTEGKLLRLTQQYFMVSASLQNIITEHLRTFGSINNFADKVALHVNDTHPAIIIPELMRILLDEYNYSWEKAWDVVTKTVTYTNHTVMPEALETWNEDFFRLRLPRLHTILCEINRRFCAELWNAYPGDWDRISRMSILSNGTIKMANLCVCASHTVNGVAALHSDILKKTVFHDFYKHTPDKFTNVTNGIAHRRWLCYSNPKLASLLDDCIGADYRKAPATLQNFRKFENDKSVLAELGAIKLANKERFAEYVKDKTGVKLDPTSRFDVQIKRMHEYKRQLLNCMRIIYLYDLLLENPDLDIYPQTFIFGAKAAPGYYMAKQIIKLIWNLQMEIEKNPKIREKLRVVFMEDYNVSLAEVLIPAAEVSEQISLAGKEASGTGNMKQMINGALTIGTFDGANVEISQCVGEDNIYIFGMRNDEVEDVWRHGYNSYDYYNRSEALKRVINRLGIGFNGVSFRDMVNYLLLSHGIADPYMCLADFDSYCAAHNRLNADYQNKELWAKKSLINIAEAGFFAADRSIEEYAQRIWHLKPVK